jgi:hypothetical protein
VKPYTAQEEHSRNKQERDNSRYLSDNRKVDVQGIKSDGNPKEQLNDSNCFQTRKELPIIHLERISDLHEPETINSWSI